MKTFKVGVSFTNRDDLSIRLYFKDINKFKPLTPEEETELLKLKMEIERHLLK